LNSIRSFLSVKTNNFILKKFRFIDILEQILMLFDARIILAKGYFHIISRNNYNNASWKERKYLAKIVKF
jgi:hypothetical protein